MEEFKKGDTVITYKEGAENVFHPEIGFEFIVQNVTKNNLYFDKNGCIHRGRCKLLVHRKEKETQIRPQHYGGEDDPYEPIKVIRAWGLGFELGNVLKYIRRAGEKGDEIEDLEKGKTYFEMRIAHLKKMKGL